MLDKKTPVVPSLHAFSDPMLRTPANVAVYLIQFMFANPGSTSSFNEGEMMSWRKLVANYGNSQLNEMATQIATMLTTSLSHYFPNGDYRASCDIEFEDGTGDDGAHLGNYGIVINIVDGDGNAIVPASKWKAAMDGSNYSMIG